MVWKAFNDQTPGLIPKILPRGKGRKEPPCLSPSPFFSRSGNSPRSVTTEIERKETSQLVRDGAVWRTQASWHHPVLRPPRPAFWLCHAVPAGRSAGPVGNPVTEESLDFILPGAPRTPSNNGMVRPGFPESDQHALGLPPSQSPSAVSSSHH